jgi:hypothetical protein
MSIVIVNPGDVISEADFASSATSIMDIINGQTLQTIRRDALGMQHVPSLMARVQDGFTRRPKDFKTATSASITTAFVGVSSSDIVDTPWETVITCNGAGGGWDLTGDCKILVVANMIVSAFDDDDQDNAAYMAVARSIDSGGYELEHTSDWRFTMADDENSANSNNDTLEGNRYIGKAMSMWTIIDRQDTADFTLDGVRLYAARGNAEWTMLSASLLVYGFYVGT